MRSSLGRTLAVLSLVECAFAYEYDATGLETGSTVVKGIYALVFIALAGLSIPVLAIARGHRVPYIPLLIALILNIFAVLASIAYDILAADVDSNDDIPADAFVATTGINSLFYSWSVALRVAKDSASSGRSHTLLLLSSSLSSRQQHRVFTSITFGLHLVMNFSAVWYASAILLGALAFFAYNKARRAGVDDKVLKTLFFVAFPIHILHVIEDIIFTILWSPSGLRATLSNRDTIESAGLAEAILYLGLHAATIATLLFVGLRRGNRFSSLAERTVRRLCSLSGADGLSSPGK